MKETHYARIYADLLENIQNEKLKMGDQLPTEMELSQAYGVSRITSKKALDLLAQEGRIVRIAGKGSFVSNTVAASAENRPLVPAVGVVMSSFSSSFGIGFFNGVQETCKEMNALAIISNPYTSQKEESAEISRLINQGVCGLILMPLHGLSYSSIILDNLLNNFPMVMADRYLPGLSVPYIGNDNEKSAQEAIEYLFRKGHRHVAFFSSMSTTSALRERISGYINAYAHSEFGLDRNLMITDLKCTMPGMSTQEIIDEDLNRIRQFFSDQPQATAALAADYGTVRLLHTALRQLGKRVPEDISLFCFDQPEELFSEYHYTHIQQDQHQLGRQATKVLFDLIQKRPLSQTQYLIGYTLVEGETVDELR